MVRIYMPTQTDTRTTAYIKKINGNTFNEAIPIDSVIDFYSNYQAHSIEGLVTDPSDGAKPVPDYIKHSLDYVVFGSVIDDKASKSNFEYNSAIFVDIEGEMTGKGKNKKQVTPITSDEILGVINKQLTDCQYIVHSTVNSTEMFARMRLIIPTNKPMNEEEYQATWDKVADKLSALPLDISSREWYRIQGLPIKNGLGADHFEIVDSEDLHLLEVSQPVTADEAKKPFTRVVPISPQDFTKAMQLAAEIDHDNLEEESNYFTWFNILANGVANGEITEEMALEASKFISLGVSEWTNKNQNRMRNELNKIKRGNLKAAKYTVREKINAIPTMNSNPSNPVKPLKHVTVKIEELPLIYTKEGAVRQLLTNVEIILNTKDWCVGVGFNEFTQEITLNREPITDNFINSLRIKIDNEYLVKFNREDVFTVVEKIAYKHSYHPIKEMIESKPWDGMKRAEEVFITYLGVEDTEYTRTVTRKWLTAAIARIYHPGTKFDLVPILQGKQGVGKSSLANRLAGEDYFVDTLKNMGKTKDDYQLLIGAWVVELGELASMRSTEVEEMKSFISATADKIRLPYGKMTGTYKRTSVFIGTTNDTEYLRDLTGNRRFLPLPIVNDPIHKWSTLDDETVQQIWAEAKTFYDDGEKLYLNDSMEEVANEYREAALEKSLAIESIETFLDMPVVEHWDNLDLQKKADYFNYYTQGKDYPYMKNDWEGLPASNTITKTSKAEILAVVFDTNQRDRNEASLGRKIKLFMDNNAEWKYTNVRINGKQTKGYKRV